MAKPDRLSDVLDKLTSRKFAVAVVYGVFVVVADALGYELDVDQLQNLTYVVLTFLGVLYLGIFPSDWIERSLRSVSVLVVGG